MSELDSSLCYRPSEPSALTRSMSCQRPSHVLRLAFFSPPARTSCTVAMHFDVQIWHQHHADEDNPYLTRRTKQSSRYSGRSKRTSRCGSREYGAQQGGHLEKFRGVLLLGLLASCASDAQREVRFATHNFSKSSISSFSTPADVRLAFLRTDEKNLPVYCAEPLPDVALSTESSFSGSLAASAALSQAVQSSASLSQENARLKERLSKAVEAYERDAKQSYQEKYSLTNEASASQSGNASLDLQAAARLAVTVSELGGRSQQVLLAREFLYRICEARANDFIKEERVYERLQVNALRLIESVYTIKPTSDAERVAAVAELLKQINANNTQQKTKCDDLFSACEIAKPKKKNECATDKIKCINAITLTKPPSFEGFGSTAHVSSILPPGDKKYTYNAMTEGGQIIHCSTNPTVDSNNKLISCNLLYNTSLLAYSKNVHFRAGTYLSLEGIEPKTGTLLGDTKIDLNAGTKAIFKGGTRIEFTLGKVTFGYPNTVSPVDALQCDPSAGVDFYNSGEVKSCKLKSGGRSNSGHNCTAGGTAIFNLSGSTLSC